MDGRLDKGLRAAAWAVLLATAAALVGVGVLTTKNDNLAAAASDAGPAAGGSR